MRYSKAIRFIQVPKHLITQWLPHPEPYGEAIVVLKNGMWTDVYTRNKGSSIITITNDQSLIKYLRQNKK
jgi:hypothetical protein